MLKSIVIRNIQSHKKTIIKLVKGVNVIVGQTQAGKTAILRAIDLVRTNRPSGSRFVRHGQTTALTTIRTMEGDKVTLKKTPKERIYKVNDSTFRKFGTAVPEEVSEALRMSDVNIQSQLDSPFLVTSTGSEITKTINRITKAEKVDEWVKLANKQVNELTREKTTTTNDLKETKDKLEVLSELPAVNDAVAKARVKLNEENQLINKWSDVEEKINEWIKRRKRLLKIERICSVEGDVESITQKQTEITEHNEEILLINDFATIFRREILLTHNIDQINDKVAEYGQLTQQITSLNDTILMVDAYTEASKDFTTISKKVDRFKNEYISEMKRVGVCPTCFNLIDVRTLKRIKSEI